MSCWVNTVFSPVTFADPLVTPSWPYRIMPDAVGICWSQITWKLKAWARSACSRASRAMAAETKLSCTQALSPSILRYTWLCTISRSLAESSRGTFWSASAAQAFNWSVTRTSPCVPPMIGALLLKFVGVIRAAIWPLRYSRARL